MAKKFLDSRSILLFFGDFSQILHFKVKVNVARPKNDGGGGGGRGGYGGGRGGGSYGGGGYGGNFANVMKAKLLFFLGFIALSC